MAKFNITRDTKEIIWHRASAIIEAESIEEAKDKLNEMISNDDYDNMSSDYMIETATPVNPLVVDFVEELNYKL